MCVFFLVGGEGWGPNFLLLHVLASEVNAAIEKDGLVMEYNHVYSRAYHRVYTQTGQKLLARAAGRKAGKEWREQS